MILLPKIRQLLHLMSFCVNQHLREMNNLKAEADEKIKFYVNKLEGAQMAKPRPVHGHLGGVKEIDLMQKTSRNKLNTYAVSISRKQRSVSTAQKVVCVIFFSPPAQFQFPHQFQPLLIG